MKNKIMANQENNAGSALLASSIACFLLGVFVLISEANATVKNALIWVERVGPLSGQVGLAILSWIVAWFVLHKYFETKPPAGKKMYQISLVLISLAFLFTFPPFFRLFAH